MNNVKKYMQDLKTCLEKCSVDELVKFIESNRKILGNKQVDDFLNSTYEVKEITLHKMRANLETLSWAERLDSAKWLIRRGYDDTIEMKNLVN